MQSTIELSSLYPRFGARIYSFLRRLTQDDLLAEDLTQATFLRAAERFHTFRGEGKVSNWLYRIATNLFRDHVRACKGEEQLLREDTENGKADDGDPFSAVPDAGPSVPQLVERHAVTQCVRDCISALPAPYRAALLLYSVEGRTVEESAAILGCSKGAVKVRLHRARQLFKGLAAEHCEVSTEGRGGEVTCSPKKQPARKPMP
jgi:RNA polymerase sigma-70 factor (ECF subfamily)